MAYNISSCFNISSRLSTRSKDDNDFLAFISSDDDDPLHVMFIGCQTQKLLDQVKFANVQNFITAIPKIFDSKIKAVILQVFDFKNKSYRSNNQFCEALKSKFDACKIPYHFLSDLNSMMGKALFAANATVNLDETILFIYSNRGLALTFKYTKDGYDRADTLFEQDLSKMDDSMIEIMTSINRPQKIIISTGKHQRRYMNILKSKNPILVDITEPDNCFKFLIEVKKWLLDKNYTKYHVIPMTPREYFVGYEFGGRNFTLMGVAHSVGLPLELTNSCSRTCFDHFIAYMDDNDHLVKCKVFKLTDKAHEFKITLKIDINNFPSYQVEGVIHDHIVNFPAFCDAYKADGINLTTYPVIGILANRSFICLCKDGKFKFSESWGSQWGKQMHITFDKKKPQFGEAAEETLAKKGKYGVQDLLQIMAEGSDAPTTITTHGYSFTKDDENPILIEFDSYNGMKKAATPEFLVAMLMKEQIKAIIAEMGSKPTSMGFCIFNDFTEKENSNIQAALEKACDLMKIQDRCFIPWK